MHNAVIEIRQQCQFKTTLGDYYVDYTSSYWNAFWFWSNHVRNEQI